LSNPAPTTFDWSDDLLRIQSVLVATRIGLTAGPTPHPDADRLAPNRFPRHGSRFGVGSLRIRPGCHFSWYLASTAISCSAPLLRHFKNSILLIEIHSFCYPQRRESAAMEFNDENGRGHWGVRFGQRHQRKSLVIVGTLPRQRLVLVKMASHFLGPGSNLVRPVHCTV
jgi:hypothetical protein